MISANGGLPAHRYTPQVTPIWPRGSEPASEPKAMIIPRISTISHKLLPGGKAPTSFGSERVMGGFGGYPLTSEGAILCQSWYMLVEKGELTILEILPSPFTPPSRPVFVLQ